MDEEGIGIPETVGAMAKDTIVRIFARLGVETPIHVAPRNQFRPVCGNSKRVAIPTGDVAVLEKKSVVRARLELRLLLPCSCGEVDRAGIRSFDQGKAIKSDPGASLRRKANGMMPRGQVPEVDSRRTELFAAGEDYLLLGNSAYRECGSLADKYLETE